MAAVCREAWLFAAGAAVGAFFMSVYDGLRLFRFLVPHHSLAVGIEDLLFWIWTGLFTFAFLYRVNDGAVRFYIVGSILGAMILYDRVVSRNLRKLLKMLIRCIRMKLRR